MPIPITAPPPSDVNNPSKEIFGASGIYYKGVFPNDPTPESGYYSGDMPNSPTPNTGILVIPTTTTTPSPNNLGHALDAADLRSGNFFVDDMLVFNNYIHYVLPLRTFNPQSFLQASVVNFNIYNRGNRPL